jgi:cell division protease FtsH
MTSKKSRNRFLLWAISTVCALVMCVLYAQSKINQPPEPVEMNISQLSKDASKGLIKEVKITPGFLFHTFEVETKAGDKFRSKGPHLEMSTAAQWADFGVSIKYADAPSDWRNLPSYLSLVLIAILVVVTIGQTLGFNFMKTASKSDVKFNDVAGSSESKSAMQEVVSYLRDPKRYESIGAKFPKGIIMDGPPGTGKTLLAKAVAGEAGANFIAVNGSDFSSKFLGVSGSKVRQVFSKARKQAPCVLFIDEIDALGGKRLAESTAVAREMSSTLNSLLVQMDGFESNSGVIVIAATNRIELLDAALLRSGRFDRHISVQLPSIDEREEILKIHAKTVSMASDFDYRCIAQACIGMSGADMANVINQAALIAIDASVSEVTTRHGLQARDRVIMGDARLSQAAVMTPEVKRLLAIHEVGHALVGMVFGPDQVDRISIVPRGGSLGQTFLSPKEERFIYERSHLLCRLRMLLGGLAAEMTVAKTQTTGASDDLARASKLALEFVGQFAMSEDAYLVITPESSDSMKQKMENSANQLLQDCMNDAKNAIQSKRVVFDKMVEKLIQDEEIYQSDVALFHQELLA